MRMSDSVSIHETSAEFSFEDEMENEDGIEYRNASTAAICDDAKEESCADLAVWHCVFLRFLVVLSRQSGFPLRGQLRGQFWQWPVLGYGMETNLQYYRPERGGHGLFLDRHLHDLRLDTSGRQRWQSDHLYGEHRIRS